MRSAGIVVPLASVFAPRLQGLSLDGRAADLALRLALLSPDYEAAARLAPPGDPLVALALGRRPAAAEGPLEEAVAEGFDGGPAPARLAALAREDRLGDALLEATSDIAHAVEGDLDDLPGAMRFLRRAGLEEVARRAALQLVILGG